jgi:sulfite exporter TauE/SafE
MYVCMYVGGGGGMCVCGYVYTHTHVHTHTHNSRLSAVARRSLARASILRLLAASQFAQAKTKTKKKNEFSEVRALVQSFRAVTVQ